jgi:cytochrome c553
MNCLKCLPKATLICFVIPLTVPFARAEQRSVPPAVVTRYCSGCHEMDGKSQLPYIPRLAGLSASYSARRLASFRAMASPPVDEAIDRILHIGSPRGDAAVARGARAHMVGVASAISDQETNAAAQWYAEQPPAPGKNRKGRDFEGGANLFNKGLDSQGVHACQSCHGSNAEGNGRAPRLAGQNSGYVMEQLAHFRAGQRCDSPEMTEIARNMANDQARAIALYLQTR